MKKKKLLPIIFVLFLLSITFNGSTNKRIIIEQNDLTIPIDRLGPLSNLF